MNPVVLLDADYARRMAASGTSRTGKFLGVPYDWRRPTKARFLERMWNSDEPRIITPRAFGWGYDVNFYWLFHRRPTSNG